MTARICGKQSRAFARAAAGIDHRDTIGADDEADIGDAAFVGFVHQIDGAEVNIDARRNLRDRQRRERLLRQKHHRRAEAMASATPRSNDASMDRLFETSDVVSPFEQRSVRRSSRIIDEALLRASNKKYRRRAALSSRRRTRSGIDLHHSNDQRSNIALARAGAICLKACLVSGFKDGGE